MNDNKKNSSFYPPQNPNALGKWRTFHSNALAISFSKSNCNLMQHKRPPLSCSDQKAQKSSQQNQSNINVKVTLIMQ